LRCLLRQLCEKVKSMTLVEATERVEREAAYQRVLGYESLRIRFDPVHEVV